MCEIGAMDLRLTYVYHFIFFRIFAVCSVITVCRCCTAQQRRCPRNVSRVR